MAEDATKARFERTPRVVVLAEDGDSEAERAASLVGELLQERGYPTARDLDGVPGSLLGAVVVVSPAALASNAFRARVDDLDRRLVPGMRPAVLWTDGAPPEVVGRSELASLLRHRTSSAATVDERAAEVAGMIAAPALGESRFAIQFEADAATALAVGELDGRPVVALGWHGGSARIADARTGQTLQLLPGHSDRVTALAFVPSGQGAFIVSAGSDGVVKAARVEDGRLIAESSGASPLAGLAVVGSDEQADAIVGDHDGTLATMPLARLDDPDVVLGVVELSRDVLWTSHDRIRAVAAIRHGGKRWIVAAVGASVAVIHPSEPRTTERATRGDVAAVALVAASGRLLAIAAGAMERAQTWDVDTGEYAGEALEPGPAVSSLAVFETPERTVLLAGDRAGGVRAWDVDAGRALPPVPVRHDDAVVALAAAEVGGEWLVYSSSADGTLRATPWRVPKARDQVEWVHDAPATTDRLERRPLARALAQRLHRIAQERSHPSFLVHLDGAWGSGKSTVLRFLRDELGDEWLVVDFDAWRESRVGPPWWSLLTALRRAQAERLSRGQRLRLWVAELRHRMRLVGAPYALALAVLVAVAVIGAVLVWPAGGLAGLGDVAGSVSGIVALLLMLWTGALVAGRFLLWHSPSGARIFERSDANPMEHLARHFAWLIARARRPVVFCIDDLDRCDEQYVVDLMDAIQTLVRDAPSRSGDNAATGPCFVVAADGAWVRRSYEVAYDRFGEAIREPGRPLGYLFLDKLFQLTVPMPTMSAAGRAAYMESLLGPAHPAVDAPASSGRSRDDAVADARARIASSTSENEVVGVLGDVDQATRHAVAGDAVQKLNAPEIERETEHALQKFHALLDPNPRSMKRFVNAYTMARAVATLQGTAIARDPLALWTIVTIRWPQLADELRAHPDAVTSPDDASDLSDDARSLLQRPDVRGVLSFDRGGPLTAQQIRTCCGG